MINGTFALGTYEINLMSAKVLDDMFDVLLSNVEYIDTAINYNNDYLIPTRKKVISKIASCHFDNYDFFVEGHLKSLNRDYIDIMLIHSNRGDWTKLALKMKDDKRFKKIGVSNFNVDDIKKYKEIVGNYPAYNEIEINPHYVDIETINFCKENNIKIIAYCIFGGKYHAMRNIADYSLGYLISYANNFADIVILRADSRRQAEEIADAIKLHDTDNDIYDIPNVKDKSMEPMTYKIPTIKKYFANELTYSIYESYNNVILTNKSMLKLDNNYEMLGDYTTYLRYFLKQYVNPCYMSDYIVVDDKAYAIRLFDKNGNLTKITTNADVYLVSYDIEVHN